MLDETYSFGMVGKHGRGVTEVSGVPVSLQDIRLKTTSAGILTESCRHRPRKSTSWLVRWQSV